MSKANSTRSNNQAGRTSDGELEEEQGAALLMEASSSLRTTTEVAGTAAPEAPAGTAASRVEIAPEYGVIMIKGALTVAEQKRVMKTIKLPKAKGPVPASFVVSHGDPGTDGRIEFFHTMGERFFTIAAEQIRAAVPEEQMKAEPAFNHLLRHLTGEAPVKVHHVAGMGYTMATKLTNHTDCPKSLFTMSVAIGHTCDFVLGQKTPRPHAKERNGPPVTIQMESGDAMFFDAGCIPHAIARIVPKTAPAHWNEEFARVSMLFREPDWL
eukprot:6145679-Prymnesium_polylepis.1